jgi:hypothetical protein
MENNLMPGSDPGALPIYIPLVGILHGQSTSLEYRHVELLPNLFESGQKKMWIQNLQSLFVLCSLSLEVAGWDSFSNAGLIHSGKTLCSRKIEFYYTT